MKRREFITILGGAAAVWPLAAHAQQAVIPTIGFLNGASKERFAPLVRSFQRGLGEAGYVDGRNVAIEYRWVDGQYDRLPELAADLVHRNVSVVIAGGGSRAPLAAKAATSTTPIVFAIGADPVQLGLVASLNRPGGNITGATNLNVEVGPKRLELLHELVPTAISLGLLINPNNLSSETLARDAQAAAHTIGVQLHVVRASTEAEFSPLFVTLDKLRAGGLVIGTDAFFNSRGEQLAALAMRYRLPAIYGVREFAVAGGAMSYGGDLTDAYHTAGVYTGRILKGDKPAILPIQQSTKVELIINLKTIKALGLTMPLTLLGRADEVIE